MLTFGSRVRIFAAVEPVDFRKGFDGLVQIVRDRFREDPFAGDLFCFFNRRRDRVKVLVWDRNGFWLHYKRLERGTFERIDAGGETTKRLEDFEWSFNPKIPKAKIVDLATCNFVEKHENVLLIGPTGVGKSHLAQAIGERACRAGHSVCYASAHRMLSTLRGSRADQSYEKKLLRFTSPDLLIVDDLGLRPLEGEEPIDIYEVIRQRYERGSMIITSNRALEEWHPLFLDELMASAAMDRLLHHSHVVVIEGHSYRNPPGARKAG